MVIKKIIIKLSALQHRLPKLINLNEFFVISRMSFRKLVL